MQNNLRKHLSLGLGIVSTLAILAWAFAPNAIEVETSMISEGRFERTVQENGKARLRDRYVVYAPIPGRVARIDLEPGDRVERNAVVATMWPANPTLMDARALQEQRERVGAMDAAVRRSSANVARARAALEQAIADLQRNETLAQHGYLSPTQNETGRLNVRVRKRELESAVQEEHAAQHEREQSRIAMRQYTPASDRRHELPWPIKAPITGKVLKIIQQSEGAVPAGAPLIELGDPARLEVVVDLLTEDASPIQPGTSATLSGWGGAHMLQARVRLVEPAAFTKVSALGVEEQRVNTILDITSPPDAWHALSDGFKVDVQILLQAQDKALKAPVSALFPLGVRSGLFTVENGRARQREVEVLARNASEGWLKSGLAPGTTVIVYPPSTLREGDAVKIINRP